MAINLVQGKQIATASWAINAITSSYITSSNVYGPFGANSIVSASYAATASYSRNLQISGSINNVDYIDFNTGSVVTQPTPGRLSWNDTDGTLDIGLKGGNVTLQIGQEEVLRVVNKTGGNLLESQYRVVRVRSVAEGGAQGQRLAVVLAQADNDDNSATTLGIVTENIDVNQEGFITTFGKVRGINTTGTLQGETWVDGDMIYLSPTTPGYITNIKPHAPDHAVILGYVIYAHANNGIIFVKVDNGYEIDELHNVKIDTGSLTPGQLLVRSGSLWINSRQLTGSYELIGSLTATSFTGSLFGTASFAVSSSRAVTSSFAISASWAPLNAGGSNTQIQFNSGSILRGTGSFTFNYQSQSLQQGLNVTASGLYSHAQGTLVTASGNYSHAEGDRTKALQQFSHAEGVLTIASGAGAHAEGAATIASGPYSHAEGTQTTASGEYSHAEGYYAQANGNNSHAEGDLTQANGIGSHAEGTYSIATGNNSHAEGNQTQAIGVGSHAEGYGNQAIGDYSHTEGNATVTLGNYSHAEGADSKTGITTAFATDKSAIINGLVILDNGNFTSYFTPGGYLYLYDGGEFDQIYNYASFLIDTVDYDGTDTLIQLVDTSVNTSRAYVGDLTYLLNNKIFGGDQTIPGIYSHAEGSVAQAIGRYSHAEGVDTNALGQNSHAEGSRTQAIGNYSHAEGQLTQAIGESSHTEGQETQAIGIYSHAEGQNTIASGSHSHAEGRSTQAIGVYSHAEGRNTISIGAASHAEGLGTVTQGDYQHVQGQYNISSSVQSAFIIGNGASTGLRSNLVFAAGSTFQVTGSLQVSGSITGSLFGTASYALNALSSSNASTASFAPAYLPLTGGTIAGSLTINNNLTVLGSASIQYISESVLNIGTNLITVNTATPAVRFGGLAIIDSGSSPQVSASFLYDSVQDEFIFVHKGTAAGAITSSHFVLGPETYNNLGNETYLTANRIPKGVGNEHLNDSNISDNGSVVSINSNSEITGSLRVTQGITGSLFGTSSWATNALSASNIVVTDNISTNATYYPILSPSSSGAVGARIDTSTLTYNPSTNTLSTGDLTLSQQGNRTLTIESSTFGGTEIKLLPNSTVGYARINVGNTAQPLDFQMNSIDVMRITQTGNVGIGTTTPSARLDVSGSVNISGSLLVGTGSILTTNTFFGFTPNLVVGMNTGSSGAVLDLRNTTPSTVAGNTLGTIQFSALGDGTAYPSSQIRSTVTNNVGSGNTGGGNISIWTAQGLTAAVPTERMRVNDRGQVLIGLTSSLDTTSKLIVSGSTTITGSLSVSQGITGSLFGTASLALASEKIIISDNPTYGGITFYPTFISSTGAQSLLIDSSIFTYNPSTNILTTTASFAQNAISASYVLQAISSSFATTASYVQNAISASYILQAVSSSFATTASYALNGGVTQIVAGTNISVTNGGSGSVTINSTGGGGGGTDLGLVQAMIVGLQNIF